MRLKPNLELVPDAKHVVFSSYTFWAAVIALLALVGPEVLYATTGRDMNPVFLWLLQVGLLLFILIGRVIVQRGSPLRNALRIVAVTVLIVLSALAATTTLAQAAPATTPLVSGAETSEAEILRLAVPFIARWEGVELVAYQDIVGVWTICSGTTRGVEPGMRKSAEDCAALLEAEALEYWRGVARYFTADTLRHRITALRGSAWTSFAINVGIRAAGTSTATRRLNAGNIAGACQALTWWNKAGQRVRRGLINRRGAEKGRCMVGVA